LAERSIHTEADLQSAVPGLTVRQTESQNQITLSIRGQSVEPFTGSASAVVPYIDEVQLNTGGASSFFDLSSIQVLKGPQGTLFGRNATGGALLLTTAKPDDQFGGYIQAGIGNYGYYEEQGAINIPIIPDKVLLRAAFDVDTRDGYIKDIFHDTTLGKVDRNNERLSLTVNATDELKNTTVLEYGHSGGNNIGDEAYAITPCNAVTAGSCAASVLYTPAALDLATGDPGAWAAYLRANPKAYPGGVTAYLAQQKRMGYWTVDDVSPSLHDEYDLFLANTTTYDLGEETQLKNIFGYTSSKTRDVTSETGSPFAIILTQDVDNGRLGNIVTPTNISDELQLQGKTFNDNLQYIVGGYYLNSDTLNVYNVTFFDLAPIIPPTPDTSDFETKDTTEAAYAQATYNLASLTGLSGLSFTGGFRYTFEQYTLDQIPAPFDPNAPAPQQTVDFSNPSWLVSLEYQFDPDWLAYISGRRSWRTGGLNGVAPPIPVGAAQGGDKFYPEYTRDVEAGLKFGGTLLDRPAHFNVAVYNQWVDDVQRYENPVAHGLTIAITVNVPSAEFTGLEIDGAIKPTDWLEIGVAGDLNDARYVSNKAALFNTIYTFGPYADAPRASGSVYGQAQLPAPERVGGMTFRADLYAQSSDYFSNTNNTITPGTKLPGYGLVNLRYDWHDIYSSHASLGVFCRNLLNKGYYVGGLAVESLGESAASVGTPRMFGAELKYTF
jgi:iron complex outermembrane receptor protein